MAKQKNRNTQQTQETNRMRIAEFLKKKRGTQKEASEIFSITERAVNAIWSRYKIGGKRALASKKRGVREGKKINGKQAAEVRRLIKDKMPDQLKLPYGLWTREAVQQLISDRYGVELSRWQIGRYLKSWGYTPQKPIAKAFEQKPKQVKAWLQKEYPAIQKKAKKESAVIYWGDETGMRSDHQAGRSYAPKGQTPVIKKTGQRFSVNMVSALSNRGHLEFMLLAGSFNGEVFIDFLKRMIKYKQQKIYLIVDGHSAHKTKTVKKWVNKNKNKIALYYLPPYSPELNPDELLNQDIKTNVTGKKRPINKEQMKNNVTVFLTNRKNDKKQVRKYFHGQYVRYAA
jgi:transposase